MKIENKMTKMKTDIKLYHTMELEIESHIFFMTDLINVKIYQKTFFNTTILNFF